MRPRRAPNEKPLHWIGAAKRDLLSFPQRLISAIGYDLSADLRFMPENPNDAATTLILRIKGSDLNALRDHRISREEARKRIEVNQY